MKKLKYQIFVINMPNSKKRYQHINSQLQKLNIDFERIDGCDISLLSDDELNKYYSLKKNYRTFPKLLIKGEIGCYIAHVKCWEKIFENNLDFGIILEDDILIDEKLPLAIKFLEDNYNKWEFIRLQQETKSRRCYNKEIFKDFSIYEFVRTSGCTWGYALNHHTTKKLLDNILPFGMTVDSNMHVYFQFDINVKTLIPPIVFARPNENSDIAISGERKKIKNLYPFARQIFSIKAYIGRYLQLIKRDKIKLFLQRIIKSEIIHP